MAYCAEIYHSREPKQGRRLLDNMGLPKETKTRPLAGLQVLDSLPLECCHSTSPLSTQSFPTFAGFSQRSLRSLW